MRHRFELRRIAPIRAANIAAVIGFVVYGVLSLIMAPFVLAMVALMPKEPGAPPPWIMVVLVALYPVFGAVFGWLFSVLAAATYNLVVRWTGGLELDFAETPQSEPTGLPAQDARSQGGA